MPRPELPPGWCEPTAGTLARYRFDISQGLVPAGHPVLSQPAEAVTAGKFNEAAAIDRRLRQVATAMRRSGRALFGLAATQIGESAQVMLAPGPGCLQSR